MVDKHKIKDKLYLSQGGECIYCDKHMHRERATIDHIMPSFEGNGGYVLACENCNSIKGSFFLFDGSYDKKKVTEELIYRILILQIYNLKVLLGHFAEIYKV